MTFFPTVDYLVKHREITWELVSQKKQYYHTLEFESRRQVKVIGLSKRDFLLTSLQKQDKPSVKTCLESACSLRSWFIFSPVSDREKLGAMIVPV